MIHSCEQRKKFFDNATRLCWLPRCLKIIQINRLGGPLVKCRRIGRVRSFPGFSPRWAPIRVASSNWDAAESQATKNRCCLYLLVISVWWIIARARLVFPIPPAPKIATLAVPWPRIRSICDSSDSGPWNIFGSDGSIEIELELAEC